ncbi:hypothetical protein SLA2020_282940 [Shorea laevis]
MGHRRWLPMEHRFRKDKRAFDGTQELDPAPIVLNGEEIMSQLNTPGFVVDESRVGEKRRVGTNEPVKWKKQSIFFTLPYWKDNLLRHNLDVMHIEKNVLDNIIGTLLDMKGKTKDNYKARLDLEEMGLRGELHPVRTDPNKTLLPAACFTMSNKEKHDFLAVLANVKVPDGYASNVSRCVKLKERCIRGLKSHDSHILMQQLMPIALRRTLPNSVVKPLIELSSFFRDICSKTLRLEDLDRLEGRIPFILCDLERIFPPGFFTVMVHVVIHLVRECKLGGPVHYRWMYPIERCLHRYKLNVRNKAAPEGSIAEGYIIEELLTYCSRYLENVTTVHNRPPRSVDDSRGAVRTVELDDTTLKQAHRYILLNTEMFAPFRTMHIEALSQTSTRQRITGEELNKKHIEEFSDWYRDYVRDMDEICRNELGEKLKWHAVGPASQVYYVADERNPNWDVVVQTKPRDVYDVGQGESNEDNVYNYVECEPFDLQIQDTHDVRLDNFDWVRNDIEGIIINNS